MKTKEFNLVFKIFIIFLTVFQMSCAMNIARTNARIEGGFHGSIGGAIGSTVGGTIENGTPNSDIERPLVEIDLGYGGKDEETVRADFQLKAGLGPFSTLDLFISPPKIGSFYYGFGVEAGFASGVYATGTYYLSPSLYVTATGRAAYDLADLANDGWLLNPQLAFGIDTSNMFDLAFFTGYTYSAGQGTDYVWSFDDINDRFSKHFMYGGVQLTF